MNDRDKDDSKYQASSDFCIVGDEANAALFRTRTIGRKNVPRATKPLSSSTNPFAWSRTTQRPLNPRLVVSLHKEDISEINTEDANTQSFVGSSADILGEIYDSYQYSIHSSDESNKSIAANSRRWARTIAVLRSTCKGRFGVHKPGVDGKSQSPTQSPTQNPPQMPSQPHNSIFRSLRRIIRTRRDRGNSFIDQNQTVSLSSKVSPRSLDSSTRTDNSPENTSITSHVLRRKVPSYSLDYRRRVEHNHYLKKIYHREVIAKAERQRIYLSKQKYANSQVLHPIDSNVMSALADETDNKTPFPNVREKYSLIDNSGDRFKPLEAFRENSSSKPSGLRTKLGIFKRIEI